MTDNTEVLFPLPGDSLLVLKPQRQGEFCRDRFHVFAGNGGLLPKASRENDSFQLFFPCDGNPQCVTHPRKEAENRVWQQSREILFDSFSAEKHLVRERRLHGKMGPLLGRFQVCVVPHHAVKPGDIVLLRSYFLFDLEPDTDAASGPVPRERLQGFVEQFFSKSAIQGSARYASPA